MATPRFGCKRCLRDGKTSRPDSFSSTLLTFLGNYNSLTIVKVPPCALRISTEDDRRKEIGSPASLICSARRVILTTRAAQKRRLAGGCETTARWSRRGDSNPRPADYESAAPLQTRKSRPRFDLCGLTALF